MRLGMAERTVEEAVRFFCVFKEGGRIGILSPK